jgi:hypothetical protein
VSGLTDGRSWFGTGTLLIGDERKFPSRDAIFLQY